MNPAPSLPYLQPMPALPPAAYVAASEAAAAVEQSEAHPASEDQQEATSTTTNNTTTNNKRKKDKKTCCVANCENKFHLQRVPAYPPPLPLYGEIPSKKRQITHAKKVFKRQEFLERLGRPRDAKFKDLRYCPNHKMEKQHFTLQVQIKNSNNNNKEGEQPQQQQQQEVVAVPVELLVPVNVAQVPPAPKLRKKKCCVKGCQNHVSLRRVPPLPKPVPLGSSKARQITRAKKVFKRNEYVKRLLGNTSTGKVNADLRFCHNHKMETRNWTFLVPIMDAQGVQIETVEATAQFEVPLQVAFYQDDAGDDCKQPAVAANHEDDRKPPAVLHEPSVSHEPVDMAVSVSMEPTSMASMEQPQQSESEAAAFEPPMAMVGRQKQQEEPEQPSDVGAYSTSAVAGGQSMQSIAML